VNDSPQRRRSGGRETKPSFLLLSPRDLPPAARRLLEAARTLLDTSGVDALTNEAVATEAGERKSLIHYYFGGKPGLLIALANWLLYDSLWDLRTRISELPGGAERVHGLVQNMASLATNSDAYTTFFALLPLLLRDARTRTRLGEFLVDGAALNARALTFDGDTVSHAQLASLGRLTMALTDGYAVQLLAGAASSEVERDLRLWEQMLDRLLLRESTSEAASPPTDSEPETP
jgi:AcrR family transcriptional regulator